MKLFIDFLPVLIFFIIYFITKDMIFATYFLIGSSALQIAILWLLHRKVEKIYWITFGFLLVLGGATILLHDVRYLKFKPTAVNWVLAFVFLGAHVFAKKNLVKLLMNRHLELPEKTWSNLNYGWIIFFFIMGSVNLWVAYSFSTDTWVKFKLFGLFGLTISFIILQSLYLARQIPQDMQPK